MASLVSLGLGALTLTPAFSPEVMEYTASTSNASNTITAKGAAGCAVAITVNDERHASGTSAVWVPGENIVEITVSNGPDGNAVVYTVVVTKREG